MHIVFDCLSNSRRDVVFDCLSLKVCNHVCSFEIKQTEAVVWSQVRYDTTTRTYDFVATSVIRGGYDKEFTC